MIFVNEEAVQSKKELVLFQLCFVLFIWWPLFLLLAAMAVQWPSASRFLEFVPVVRPVKLIFQGFCTYLWHITKTLWGDSCLQKTRSNRKIVLIYHLVILLSFCFPKLNVIIFEFESQHFIGEMLQFLQYFVKILAAHPKPGGEIRRFLKILSFVST